MTEKIKQEVLEEIIKIVDEDAMFFECRICGLEHFTSRNEIENHIYEDHPRELQYLTIKKCQEIKEKDIIILINAGRKDEHQKIISKIKKFKQNLIDRRIGGEGGNSEVIDLKIIAIIEL